MALEVESKQRIPDLRTAERLMAAPIIQSCLQEDWQTKRMASSYYDTPTHALNQRRWALRLRQEGETTVAALKMSRQDGVAGLAARDEWQCPAGDIRSAIPRLVRMGAPADLLTLTQDSELVERCRIEFLRTTGILELPGGTIVEMDVDNGHILIEDRQEAFIELEMEVLFGDPAEVADLARRLAEEYGLVTEHAGKYERALRLLRSRAGKN